MIRYLHRPPLCSTKAAGGALGTDCLRGPGLFLGPRKTCAIVPISHRKKGGGKIMATKKTPKCRHMMYVQKIDHLPVKDFDALKDIIEQQVSPERYAMILHDKDMDAHGQPIVPDVHVMMSFSNARHVSSIAKILQDKPQYIQAWSQNEGNGYAYLTHRTKQAQIAGKYQYDPGEVIANFDYPSYLLSLRTKAVQKTRQQDMAAKDLIDAMYAGILSRDDVESRLTGSQLGYYKRQLDIVWNKVLQNRAADWRRKMQEQGKQVTVIWIYGAAGTGKTRLARHYAAQSGQPYYMSGSSRDIFQSYAGEHTIILDELRPRNLEYQDLLRILDPFGLIEGTMAPSRYSDKALAADTIIITSPFSPLEFYWAQFSDTCNQIDSFAQLARRISLTVQMQQASIDLVTYDEHTGSYRPVNSRPNPYSQQARPAPQDGAEKLFSQIVD